MATFIRHYRFNDNIKLNRNMKKTIKKATITKVYGILNTAKLSKCPAQVRRAAFGAMYPMKAVAGECADYEREAAKRLQPEGYQAVVDVINEFNAMSPTEREEAVKQSKYMNALRANFDFNREVNKCVSEHLAEDVEIDLEPLTDEFFDALCDSNPDWTLGQCIELQDALCEKGGEV